MDTYEFIHKYGKITIIVILLIIAAAVIIPRVVEVTRKVPRMEISDQELANTPTSIKDDLGEKIYQQIQTDTGKNLSSGAAVRKDSKTSVTIDDSVIDIFIIDVDEAKQSYLVYYSYDKNYEASEVDKSDAVENVQLFCLSNPSHIIYEGSGCNETSSFPDEQTITLYLPPTIIEYGNNKTAPVYFEKYNEVAIEVEECGIVAESDILTEKAKNWVKTFGLNTDNIEFEIKQNFTKCEL